MYALESLPLRESLRIQHRGAHGCWDCWPQEGTQSDSTLSHCRPRLAEIYILHSAHVGKEGWLGAQIDKQACFSFRAQFYLRYCGFQCEADLLLPIVAVLS
jgi:hypothetical protein